MIGDEFSFDANLGMDNPNGNSTRNSGSGASLQDQQLEEAFANLQPRQRLSLDDLPGAIKLGRAEVGAQIFPQELVALINQGGDMLNGEAGTNEIRAAGGNDLIEIKDQGGVNFVTTGAGQDTLHFGDDDGGASLIRDFDPTQDQLGISQEMALNRMGIAQFGNSTLILDDKGDVAVALQGVSPDQITTDNLRPLGNVAVRGVKRGIGGEEVAERFGSGGSFDAATFDGEVRTTPRGAGDALLEGTSGNDKLTGREGNDLLTSLPTA